MFGGEIPSGESDYSEMIDDETKKAIIQALNIKIGSDINDLSGIQTLEDVLVRKRNHLQSSLKQASNEVPTKLLTAVKKAEGSLQKIEDLKAQSEMQKEKVEAFLDKTQSLQNDLSTRCYSIQKLEETLAYLQSFEKINDLSDQLKACKDDEQAVLLYGELKEMCMLYHRGHRAAYAKEYTHYWHNILKDKFAKNYEKLLNTLKWPTQTLADIFPPPKETLLKFSNLTKYLFLIQEPVYLHTSNITDSWQDQEPCLPVKILLRPLKKRFLFHFTGNRQTARIDRPEWFLSQTLKWIKLHHPFVRTQIQSVADTLQMKNVRAVDEFIAGVVALAAERLHTVLGLYNSQTSKGEPMDMDAAFAHAVDETLGFHKELSALTGNDANAVLSVLTKAEIFVKWLAVEKKYALAKMDETLGSEQWSESVGAGVNVAVGAVVWVPKGADWFIALLRTIEDRYAVLPQPGHRLQFLELQLELVEEWRVRLTQLKNAALAVIMSDSSPTADSSRQLTAVINAAHHTKSVLLQWAHSLHYLQLHYYRRQFQQFTQQQHHEDPDISSFFDNDDQHSLNSSKADGENYEVMSLKEVEQRAQKLALDDVSRRDSSILELMLDQNTSPVKKFMDKENDMEEAGVFSEAPALLARLRDKGLAALSDRILFEFKAAIRDYRKQKWYAMSTPDGQTQSPTVSPALCRPLSALYMRVTQAAERLAPALAHRLRLHVATSLDIYIFEEVVLENWFNSGGILQFTHDVKRNIVPAFAPPNKCARINMFPRLEDACTILSIDFHEARRLRSVLNKMPKSVATQLNEAGVKHISPDDVLRILNQRTDLSDVSSPSSVMELF